jgi:hypothetical protein
MKLSELIKPLQEIYHEYGDPDIQIDVCDDVLIVSKTYKIRGGETITICEPIKRIPIE